MSDRIVLMRGGRIVQHGSAESLYDRPENLFVARFFSHLNELPGKVQSGRVSTPIGAFAAESLAEGQAVTVAIRPRGVLIEPASGAAEKAAEGTPGRIMSRHFLGEIDLFEVAVDGSDTYLQAKARAGEGLVPGADVRVNFDARDVLVFPEEERPRN